MDSPKPVPSVIHYETKFSIKGVPYLASIPSTCILKTISGGNFPNADTIMQIPLFKIFQ